MKGKIVIWKHTDFIQNKFLFLCYLYFGIFLHLTDSSKFQVQRVDDQEGQHVEHVQQRPAQQHEDVVRKDVIVGDSGEHPADKPPGDEETHGHEPALETSFLL